MTNSGVDLHESLLDLVHGKARMTNSGVDLHERLLDLVHGKQE